LQIFWDSPQAKRRKAPWGPSARLWNGGLGALLSSWAVRQRQA